MLGLIWAQATNGAIGIGNAMPWHLPEDLARFRRLTEGATVVMGRATWQSLPPRFRPLPGRRNVVVSRDPGFDAPGAQVLPLDQALASPGDVWVIGGGQVYAQAIAYADVLEVTTVDAAVAGDTYALVVGPRWQLADGGPRAPWQVSSTALRYRFDTWSRRTRTVDR